MAVRRWAFRSTSSLLVIWAKACSLDVLCRWNLDACSGEARPVIPSAGMGHVGPERALTGHPCGHRHRLHPGGCRGVRPRPTATALFPGLRRSKVLLRAPGSGTGNPQRSREASATCGDRAGVSLLRLPASLLTIALTGQRLLDAEFLAWLQVEGVPLDLTDDVLLNDLPLEAAERVLNSLAFLEPYVSQTAPPPRSSSCVVIIRPLRSSEPPRRAPASPSVPCWA